MEVNTQPRGDLPETWIGAAIESQGADLVYSDCVEGRAARLTSFAWRGELAGFYRARLCIFEAEKKFRAETLVIYPSVGHFLPIFGSEYIELPTKSLAVVDFHPVNGNFSPIGHYLSSEPDRTIENSAHYDLNGFFSPKMWHKRGGKEVYEGYKGACERYLGAYFAMLKSNPRGSADYPSSHSLYNQYMAAHDPARGILKAYFGSDFADEYIRQFLFGQKGSES